MKDEPAIAIDNIEVAQFIYLLLHNEKIRDVIDTIGKKGVLLLGRFTEGRMEVLERLRAREAEEDWGRTRALNQSCVDRLQLCNSLLARHGSVVANCIGAAGERGCAKSALIHFKEQARLGKLVRCLLERRRPSGLSRDINAATNKIYGPPQKHSLQRSRGGRTPSYRLSFPRVSAAKRSDTGNA